VAIPPYQKVKLTWAPSTDNVAVMGYQVFAGDVLSATTPDTSYVFDKSTWNTHYTFAVRAEDAVGNVSGISDTAGVTTGGPPAIAYLSDLDWISATTGWKTVQRDKSIDGNTITLNGVKYAKGIGTHANSTIVYFLGKQFDRFKSYVGVDDEKTAASTVGFAVYVDGVNTFDSGVMNPASRTQTVDVGLHGADTLKLVVDDAGDGNNSDHADWANALVSRDTASSAVDSPLHEIPGSFRLEESYPNPFNPTTTIRFGLPRRSHATLRIFNTLGQQVQELVNGDIDPGTHEVQFDGSRLASGVYFYRLQTREFTQTRKLVLTR
jgi:chitodextrinase